MFRLVVQITCCVCLVSCFRERGANSDSNQSPEVAVLEKKIASYYEHMSQRDWIKYREYFWDSATIPTAWQKAGDSAVEVHIITIDEFIDQTPDGPDSQPVFSERMKNASIQVRNDLACAWVEYDAEFGKPDSLMTWSGIDLFTFLRNEDEWKIVSLVF